MEFSERLKNLVKSIQDPDAVRLLHEAIAHIEEQNREKKRRSRRPSEVCVSEGCSSRPFEDGECWTCPSCTRALKDKIAALQADLVELENQLPQGRSRNEKALRERGSQNPQNTPVPSRRVYFRGELLSPGTHYIWSAESVFPKFDERILKKVSTPWVGPPMLKIVHLDGSTNEFDWDGQGWVQASGDHE